MRGAEKRAMYCLGFGETANVQMNGPDRYRAVLGLATPGPFSIQGAGLSLCGASFANGARVIGMRRFDRILGFDSEGLTLDAESGITLGQLFSFLGPLQLQVPVQPGYPGITLGGCIAANVHGKNQFREGVFANIVEAISLFHPSHGVLRLDRSTHRDLFDLTCGGFGLTGVILSAKIRLSRISGGRVQIITRPVASLLAAVENLVTSHGEIDFCYTWHDGAWFGRNFGQGMIVLGRAIPGGVEVPEPWSDLNLSYSYPIKLFNRFTMPVVNLLFFYLKQKKTIDIKLFDAIFPFARQPHYFYAYGPEGFIEHQVIFSHEKSGQYLERFEALCRLFRPTLGLLTMKLFKGTPRLLAFDGTGISLAFHVARNTVASSFLRAVDALDIEEGARANIIKDARLPAHAVRAQYPERDEFVVRLKEFDPKRIFESSLSQRLEL